MAKKKSKGKNRKKKKTKSSPPPPLPPPTGLAIPWASTTKALEAVSKRELVDFIKENSSQALLAEYKLEAGNAKAAKKHNKEHLIQSYRECLRRYCCSDNRVPSGMCDVRETKIVGDTIELIPFRASHVSRYHGWMQDEWTREMVSGQILTLKETHNLQKEWAEDKSKVTFIISMRGADDVIVGDVNLFLEDDSDVSAEMIIMIGDPKFYRKGIATEAMRLSIRFAHCCLGLNHFIAKISKQNGPSLKLFRKLKWEEFNDKNGMDEKLEEIWFSLNLEEENEETESLWKFPTMRLQLFPETVYSE
eukprot:g5216.t1